MVDHKIVYNPHPAYNQFVKWMGNDNNNEHYFMMNTSLYAAEQYIKNRFDVHLFAHSLTEPTTSVRPLYNPTNILALLSNGNMILPTVPYFSTSENKYINSSGDYTITDDNTISMSTSGNNLYRQAYDVTLNSYLSGQVSDVLIKYVTGFVLKDASLNVIVENADDVPEVRLPNGNPVPFPMYSLDATVDVKVYGSDGDKIIINGVDTLDVIQPNGEQSITLENKSLLNNISIILQDTDGKNTRPTTITIIKDELPVINEIVVLGYNKVINTDTTKLMIYSTGGDLTVNGSITPVDTGITEIEVPITDDVQFIQYSLSNNGNTTNIEVLPILKDVTLDNLYIQEVNKNQLNVKYMPMDLLVAMFRITQIMYKATLYKTEDVSRYSTGTAQSVTFTSSKIPKDILEVIHRYTQY